MKQGFFKLVNMLSARGNLEFIFYCLVFIMPFQARIAYFTNDSYINNFYIFYHTFFLYLTDILLILLVSLWLIAVARGMFHVEQIFNIQNVYLSILMIIAIFSVLVSQETNTPIQYFSLFKLFLSILLFCFILNFVVKQLFHKIFWLILAVSIIQIGIGTFQYFQQKSFGLKILGEEFLRNYLPGVAAIKMPFGQRWTFDQIFDVYRETLVMRPYGTFPHPNVYAAFLFVSLIVSYYLFLVSRETWKRYLVGAVIFLQIFGLFMSFSRVAIVAFVIVTVIFFTLLFVMKQKESASEAKKQEADVSKYHSELSLENSRELKKSVLFHMKPLIAIVGVGVILGFGLFYQQFLERGAVVSRGTTNQTAVSDRVLYQKIAWEMVKKNPLTGVGYQSFVLIMDRYSPIPLKDYQHQPVHNVYLLVAAELGMFGILVFLLFLGSIMWLAYRTPWNIAKITLFSVFTGFLFIGLFDHYLLTIQQGRLLFFLIAGLLVVALEDVVKSKPALL